MKSGRRYLGHIADSIEVATLLAELSCLAGRPSPWVRAPPRSAAHQLHELRCRRDLRGECRAALGLFGVLAPGLDLKAFVELRGGEGRGGVETPFEQCQGDDQRAAGGGRGVQRGQREIVVPGDRRGKGREARRRLVRRDDPGGDRERRVIALAPPSRSAAARPPAGGRRAPADGLPDSRRGRSRHSRRPGARPLRAAPGFGRSWSPARRVSGIVSPANFALLRLPLRRDRCGQRRARHDQVALPRRLDEPAVEGDAVTAGSRHDLGLLVEALHIERSANGSSTSSGEAEEFPGLPHMARERCGDPQGAAERMRDRQRARVQMQPLRHRGRRRDARRRRRICASPRIGVPIAAQWARSWWVRPVTGSKASQLASVADAVDHLVIGDGVLAFLGIGAHPFARRPGELGQRQVDAPLPQLRQADDDRPIDLARRLLAKRAGQESRRRGGAGDDQHAARVLVEPVDEARPLVRAEAQRVEQPVEMPLGSAAALDGETGRLVRARSPRRRDAAPRPAASASSPGETCRGACGAGAVISSSGGTRIA